MFTDLDRPPLLGPRGGRLLADDPHWRVAVVERTGSTNEDLVAAVRAGRAGPGDVLVAEHQQAGRGRAGRSWSSPPRAGLTVSVALGGKPTSWVPLLAGVAAARAVAEVTGVRPLLKWPNDLQVDGRKLAGVLAQVAAPEVVVVGVGLNVTTRREELPPGLAATSLVLEGAAVTDRRTLLIALLRALRRPWTAQDYRQLSATLGQQVAVQLPGGETVRGRADGLDDDGRLVVAGRAFGAGDVVHLR